MGAKSIKEGLLIFRGLDMFVQLDEGQHIGDLFHDFRGLTICNVPARYFSYTLKSVSGNPEHMLQRTTPVSYRDVYVTKTGRNTVKVDINRGSCIICGIQIRDRLKEMIPTMPDEHICYIGLSHGNFRPLTRISNSDFLINMGQVQDWGNLIAPALERRRQEKLRRGY